MITENLLNELTLQVHEDTVVVLAAAEPLEALAREAPLARNCVPQVKRTVSLQVVLVDTLDILVRDRAELELSKHYSCQIVKTVGPSNDNTGRLPQCPP